MSELNILDLDDDGEIGEQVETEYLTIDHSEIQPGDRICFRYWHKAFRKEGGFVIVPGTILQILPGYEMAYFCEVCGHDVSWPDQIISRRDIVKVFHGHF